VEAKVPDEEKRPDRGKESLLVVINTMENRNWGTSLIFITPFNKKLTLEG
jgi:hypothetical protein